MSVALPAEKGTTNRMGLLGNPCAWAGRANAACIAIPAKIVPKRDQNLFIKILPFVSMKFRRAEFQARACWPVTVFLSLPAGAGVCEPGHAARPAGHQRLGSSTMAVPKAETSLS